EFFNDWVYGQGFPSYTIQAHNVASGQAQITINQTQSHGSVAFFEMPVPVRLYGNGGVYHDVVLDNTYNGQEFVVSVPFVITNLDFDVKKDIISLNNQTFLSVSDLELKEISFYPNPTQGRLYLDIPNGISLEKVTFYDLNGKKILETKD